MGPKRKLLSEDELSKKQHKKKNDLKALFSLPTMNIDQINEEYFKIFVDPNDTIKSYLKYQSKILQNESDVKFMKRFIQRDSAFDLRRSKRKKKKVIKYDETVFKIPLAPAPRIKRTPVSSRPRGSKYKVEAYKKIASSWTNSTQDFSETSPELRYFPHYVQKLYCNGIKFKTGDIVSCRNEDDNVYYAIIRHLIEYSKIKEPSCVIRWLINTKASPPSNEMFDPDTYLIGPEETEPRKLEYFDLIMRCPSKYYAEKIGLVKTKKILEK